MMMVMTAMMTMLLLAFSRFSQSRGFNAMFKSYEVMGTLRKW